MADLSRADLNKHVGIYPVMTTEEGCFEIPAEKVFLEPHQASEFIGKLKKRGLLNVIEGSLQSLVQTPEGLNLLTASPSFDEFTSAIEDTEFMGVLFMFVLGNWKSLGATEIHVDFYDIQQ